MFTRKSDEEILLTESIDDAVRMLDPGNDDYLRMIGAIERLYQLRDKEYSKRISPDTRAIVIGNLVGILTILYFERMNVITSKALNFVLKIR